MKQEPVAWIYTVNGNWPVYSDVLPPDDAYDEGTLTTLYTEPQYRELSDEEIKSLIPDTGAWWCEVGEDNAIEFARAILRKAQEK